MWWLWSDQHLVAILLLVGGVLGLLIGVLAGSTPGLALAGLSPRRRAIVHWLPISTTAIVCTLLGHVEMGIGIAFGTSVAALSALTGFVALAGPMDELPSDATAIWSFMPAAAMLAFVVGFKGAVGPFEATLLLIQGSLVAMIWPRRMGENTMEQPWLFTKPRAARPAASDRPAFRLLEIAAALALAALSAWIITRGAVELSLRDVRYSTNTIATTILSVTLAMPLIGMGTPLASRGRAWVPLTAHVGLVYLNLCFLLPLLILLAVLVNHLPHATTAPASAALWASVIYPRVTWRIDALVTLALSLLFVPISAGRLKLDHRLGGWLVVAYCIYLLAAIAAGMQM